VAGGWNNPAGNGKWSEPQGWVPTLELDLELPQVVLPGPALNSPTGPENPRLCSLSRRHRNQDRHVCMTGR
jgi:hypothetical protein